jgi:hypothetical protein
MEWSSPRDPRRVDKAIEDGGLPTLVAHISFPVGPKHAARNGVASECLKDFTATPKEFAHDSSTRVVACAPHKKNLPQRCATAIWRWKS